MKWRELLKRDILQGIWRKKSLFLFCPLLIWVSCLDLNNKLYQLKQVYDIKGKAGFLDYWIFLIQGRETYVLSMQTYYDFRMIWLLFFAFLFVVINMYPTVDLEQWGYQVIIHSQNRWKWWLSKCIWCILCAAVYFLLALVTILVFSLLTGARINLTPSWYIMESYGSERIVDLPLLKLLVIILVQPFLLACLLGILQMSLSFILHPMVSFCLVFALLITSTYWTNYVLCGNLGMALRMRDISDGGLDSNLCMILLVAEIIACIFFGGKMFERKDILG